MSTVARAPCPNVAAAGKGYSWATHDTRLRLKAGFSEADLIHRKRYHGKGDGGGA